MHPLNVPDELVLSRDCYRACLSGLALNLWDDKQQEDLTVAAYHQRGDPLPERVLEHSVTQLRAAMIEPWWLRRDYVAERWSPATHVFVAGLIATFDLVLLDREWLYVDVREKMWPMHGDILGARGPDQQSEAIFQGLPLTRNYCAWLADGCDADLGRYIALYYYAVSKGFA